MAGRLGHTVSLLPGRPSFHFSSGGMVKEQTHGESVFGEPVHPEATSSFCPSFHGISGSVGSSIPVKRLARSAHRVVDRAGLSASRRKSRPSSLHEGRDMESVAGGFPRSSNRRKRVLSPNSPRSLLKVRDSAAQSSLRLDLFGLPCGLARCRPCASTFDFCSPPFIGFILPKGPAMFAWSLLCDGGCPKHRRPAGRRVGRVLVTLSDHYS